jgi:hypothetical protein
MSSPNSLPVNLPLPDVDAWILGSERHTVTRGRSLLDR